MGNGWENFPQEDSHKNMIRKVKIFDLVPGEKDILGGPICCNYGAATMLVIVPVMLVV